MGGLYYQKQKEISNQGIQIGYGMYPGGHHPLHWHEEVEILYPLNGEAYLSVEGEKHYLRRKQFLVVDAGNVHSITVENSLCMYLCIHISKKVMTKYIPDLELFDLSLFPEEIPDEKFEQYVELCGYLVNMVRLYVDPPYTAKMEVEGITLQFFARLVYYFGIHKAPQIQDRGEDNKERLRQILDYVEEHYKDSISLGEAAEVIGVGREHFCRFFKKNMGVSFLEYVNDIRVTHMYHDLRSSDLPIAEIMEKNGFTNQKLANRVFKEIYGCTPSQARKKALQVTE